MSSSLVSPKKRVKSEVDVDDDCCGICYAERGFSIAGEIDCCNHYFCFVCIMEWAKHESRCPICRQRFSNVRRLPMHGVFSSSRDVKVPLRDQVYHPHGNMTTGPSDSYAEVKCSICHVGTDENLLLLCDLCDTASHTYCAGLGFTIPEGDWFCHDCAISRETYANQESDKQNVVPTAEPSATISDIVRVPSSQVVRRQSASPLQQNQSSPVIPLPDRVSRFKGKKPVSDFQRVQRNVQAFRENWNSLRSGSLRFHSNSVQSGGTNSQKQDSSSSSLGKLDDSHSMASTGLQQSTVQGGPSSNMLNERGLKDIDKAWKMMDRAKTMQQTHQRTSSIPQAVDNPSCSGGARKVPFAHCNYPELKNQQSRTLILRYTRMEKQCNSSLSRNLENHWSPKLGEKKQSRVPCEEEMIQHVRDHTTHSEGYCERPLLRKVHAGIQGFPCREDGERNVAKEQSRSACLVTSVGSAPSHGKFGSVLTSNGDMDIINEKNRLAKSFGDGNPSKIEDAKTEIQSLVKLNLKFLTRDKQLGVNTFKAVARQATHTILAACSSEQPSSSVCSHTDHTQFPKSTLMPNCCRQCFHAFVNNVVNSIVLEKVGCA
ncbi:uncharacterized protein LOC133304973 isoform X2 [Gastrolobium bilobum]|uniref:uncharacterized protein LOC133304973 isoform X2 n=1 Tax=Gastrolobium bilobum TaxID=150636 RepID=UPI002AB08A72|nr:uncharacterized protein LOC133304973 isoform X2 [Gastrolobium bilobum]